VDLLKKLLCINPQQRISAKDVLCDKWFVDAIRGNSEHGCEISTSGLRNYQMQVSLLKQILVCVASQKLSPQHEGYMKQIFNMIDQNGDGEISPSELIKGYKGIYNNCARAIKEADHVIKHLGSTDSSLIDYDGIIINLI
jgi:hypothetical protein